MSTVIPYCVVQQLVDDLVWRRNPVCHYREYRKNRGMVATGHKRVGVLAVGFNAGTDDLRESPMVALIEQAVGKGLEQHIYDRDVSASELMGANREYIEPEVPQIWVLMCSSVPEVVRGADVIVVGNGSAEFRSVPEALPDNQILMHLVRAFGPVAEWGSQHQGIAW